MPTDNNKQPPSSGTDTPINSREFSKADDPCSSPQTPPVLVELSGAVDNPRRKITIIEGCCNRCGYDRLKKIRDGIGERTTLICNGCEAIQQEDGSHTRRGYTSKRIEREERLGVEIAETAAHTIYDLEPKTGKPYITLTSTNEITRVKKSNIVRLFKTLVLDTDYSKNNLQETLSDESQRALIETFTV